MPALRTIPCMAAGTSRGALFKSLMNPMKSIYVGNLPFTASEDDVRDLFEAHGQVESVRLMTDRDTGRPRGFGVVKMGSDEAAAAIRALNGTSMGGRALKINEAEDRKPAGDRPMRSANNRW